MARESGDRDVLLRRLDEAKANLAEARADYGIAVFTAYQKPARAERLIKEHYERHGRESLVKELRENPEQFGLRQGHMLSRDGWRKDAPAREQHAKEALLELAGKAEAVVLCARQVAALEESVAPELNRDLVLQRERDRSGPER